MYKLSMLMMGALIGLPNAAGNFTCVNPEVTSCYKAKVDECFTNFEKDDQNSFKALDVLPDRNISDKIKGILMKGKEFNEIWKVEQPGDGFVYFSALKFEEIGFLQDYQFFSATLELSAQSDPSYMTAFNVLSNQFDSIFYGVCLKEKVNPDQEEEPVVGYEGKLQFVQ